MDTKTFGEFVRFDEKDRTEAKTYLESWKKFLLLKLQTDADGINIIEEIYTERDGIYDPSMNSYPCISLKLSLEADWHYELGSWKNK